MVVLVEQVEALARRIDLRSLPLNQADQYYRGEQPLSYLSPQAQKALGNRLSSISINYVKLAIDSLAERLTVDGFEVDGQSLNETWADWQRCGMARSSKIAILEALALGQSFITVWADSEGLPVISVDTPREMAITRDPLTSEIVTALKRWVDVDRTSRAVLFEADKITTWSGPFVPEGGALPSVGWTHSATLANPLGVVPISDLTNSGRLADIDGTPEGIGLHPIVNAVQKVVSDELVASEATALPRRWATGLQIQEDEAGNVINPFSTEPGTVWASESEGTTFGAFAEPSLGAFDSLTTMLIRQIGALAGLPDQMLGIAGTDPSSAEQIRASEASLVSRAYARQVTFTPATSRTAALCEAIRTGGPVRSDVVTVWKSPESRTVAQAADAASKLVASGIISVARAQRDLGFTPAEVEAERVAILRTALDRAPLTLPPRCGRLMTTTEIEIAAIQEESSPAAQAMAVAAAYAAAVEHGINTRALAWVVTGQITQAGFCDAAAQQVLAGMAKATLAGEFFAEVEWNHRVSPRVIPDTELERLVQAFDVISSEGEETATANAMADDPDTSYEQMMMRSSRLARSEITQAARIGYAEAAEQAIADEPEEFVWAFEAATKACARCQNLAAEEFESAEDAPPEGGHPGCTCLLLPQMR